MRTYEMTVIIRADLSEGDLDAQFETIQKWIETNEGKINRVDHWGHRKLAYPINKQRDGYYVLYELELLPTAPPEIERNLQIAESVLRYLIVRKDE